MDFSFFVNIQIFDFKQSTFLLTKENHILLAKLNLKPYLCEK